MPIKTDKLGVLSRRANRSVVVLDEPPLSHLQALILKKLDDLGDEAYGYKVIEGLSLETGVWLDPSQVYTNIKKMSGKGFLAKPDVRQPPEGGPPVKVYKLTPAGRDALRSTAEHYQAVADYLNKTRKASRNSG
jgi:DNA-binding PadR family transcriptional regulator